MFDTNNLVDNKELAAQMEILKSRNSIVNSNAFINGLLKAHFLLPAPISCPSSQVSRSPEVHESENIRIIIKKKDTVMAFPFYSDTSNNHYMMVFTDWDELRQWPAFQPDQKTLVHTYSDICQMFEEQPDMYSGFAINPFGRNLVITRKTISKIRSRLQDAAGVSFRPPKRDDRIFLAEPKIFPLDLAVPLRKCMRSRPDVMTAYLLLMIRGGKQSYLAVINCTGDYTELFDILRDLSLPYLKTGQLIRFEPANSILGQQAIQDRIPFFAKWEK